MSIKKTILVDGNHGNTYPIRITFSRKRRSISEGITFDIKSYLKYIEEFNKLIKEKNK